MNKEDIIDNSIKKDIIKVVTAKDFDLSKNDESKRVSPIVFARSVRSLMQNWRQGTVASKARSCVSKSGKKPWKQKGTGRARAGSARSPLWRGGGVTFGPSPRIKKISIAKSVRKKTMKAVFLNMLLENKIFSIDWSLSHDKPKTSLAYVMLKTLNLLDKKITIFLPFTDQLTSASFANIPSVHIVYFDQPNVYNLTKNNYWILFSKDTEEFKRMVSQWN